MSRNNKKLRSCFSIFMVLLAIAAMVFAIIWAIPKFKGDINNQPLNTSSENEMISFINSQAEEETSSQEETQADDAAQVQANLPYCTRAYEVLSEMTLHEKVCQLFIIFPEAITDVSAAKSAGETTRNALEQFPVGGFIYDKTNMTSKDQIKTMISNVQSFADIPLFISCDEEGGNVNRLMASVGTTYIDSMFEYRDDGEETAFSNAKTIANDMKELGFNLNFAPVADVWSNPENTVIGDRAFSDDFPQASQLVAAAVKGFHEGEIACTIKHFPGHGDTSTDSHFDSSYVDKTLEQLRENELLPFQSGIDAGADLVMMGHLIVSDIDNEPAPFSHKIVTELLRDEMGFDGIIITDSLQMKAITENYSSAQVAVKAINAGTDILLCPEDFELAVQTLKECVKSGEISEERIDDSVLKILDLKIKYEIMK